MAMWIVLGIVVLVVLYVIGLYNRLIRSKNVVKEAWSGIDVQLKRRHDLIPNLVNTTKGYATHERELLQAVTEARSARTPAQAAKAEGEVSRLLGTFIATAEAYPDLKANAEFAKVMDELSKLEDQLQMARRYYNGTVREYNTSIGLFPANFIARLFGFGPEEYFELENRAEADVPVVDFSK